MQWIIGGITLAAVGVFLRRILRLDAPSKPKADGMGVLRGERQALYELIAREIEAHATILGITLNDAFGEREEKRHEMAWRVVRLAMGEWNRLTELLTGLQTIITKFLPTTTGIVPVRRVAVGHFKSRSMKDNVGLYEFLDQVLFSSKHRFALQLRLLLRATATLSKDFKRTCREGEFALDSSGELWTRLDYYFHDFDLIAKETLLAFQILLACQSPNSMQELTLDLQVLLERGVRVSVSPSQQ